MATSGSVQRTRPSTYTIELASAEQREAIYRMRHTIYADELGQHLQNATGSLHDELDDRNVYIAGVAGGAVVGFISITAPGDRYSIDKYLRRESLPFPCDDRTYELRLLSVAPAHRRRPLAALLMYAAFRWVESRGGTNVVALGRDEVLDLYLQTGLRPTGETVRSGAVLYHLLHESTDRIRSSIAGRGAILRRLERDTRWALPIPFVAPPPCYHGGAFFDEVGDGFDRLERAGEIINADVLDAWFPPSPRVLAALRDNLPWLVRTSPPTQCAGLIRSISRARGLEPASLVPGAGSSDLIFRAFTRWLTPRSRVLILDPMYGEYAHLLESVIRCTVDRFRLSRRDGYRVDLAALRERLDRGRYDLAVLVNPNSPTGQHLSGRALERALDGVPGSTRVWIDETYVDYVGEDESLERFAAERANVVVCKSMSKVYALSGMRAAYLASAPDVAAELRAYTPPWVIGLPAQVAAVNAVDDLPYYRARWRETELLRAGLAASLTSLGMDVLPGVANFLLCHLPEDGPDAATVVAHARTERLFLRDAAPMGSRMGSRAIRIAVKDAPTNRRMVEILSRILPVDWRMRAG